LMLLVIYYIVSRTPGWIAARGMGDGTLEFTKTEEDQ
jgi:hypothetical protein